MAALARFSCLPTVADPTPLAMQARWWYRHLCDPRCEDEELPRLSGLAQPDADPQFWPAVHTLVAQGLPERAVQLLQLHPALLQLRGGADGAGLSAAEAGLLVRLEAGDASGEQRRGDDLAALLETDGALFQRLLHQVEFHKPPSPASRAAQLGA